MNKNCMSDVLVIYTSFSFTKVKSQMDKDIKNIYITADCHGNFSEVERFCKTFQTDPRYDMIIILGDAGINYYGNDYGDEKRKEKINKLPITLFCIHGNHEARPQTIPTYEEIEFCEGKAYIESKYSNIIFAKDGEIYNFKNTKCIAIGGAYSVDKYWRLQCGNKWFEDEQPSDEIKAYVEKQLKENKVDYILSHTCPLCYIPTDVFLHGIDQSTVDNSTEKWLQKIKESTTYKKWYCGHYHLARTIDNFRFVDIDE